MQNEELLEKIFKLQTESCERDARLETQMTEFSKRMDRTEVLLERMGEVLNEHKHLSSVVDALTMQVAEVKDLTRKNSDEIRIIKEAPAKTTHETVKKIVWIIIPIFVTAMCGGMIAFIKRVFSLIQ